MHLVRSLVDERGQRKSARLVRADRKAMLAQITTLYNHVERKKHLRTLISPPPKKERERILRMRTHVYPFARCFYLFRVTHE